MARFNSLRNLSRPFPIICRLSLLSLAIASSFALDFVVTNTNDSGPGSLRTALQSANSSPGADTVRFQIPGVEPHAIALRTALPTISDPVTVDGQPGNFSEPRRIELDGRNAGAAANGLTISAGNCTIRGLAINGFSGNGILIQFGGRNVLQGNFLGSDPTGRIRRANGQSGVTIVDSSGSLIGGIEPSQGNLLSGNLTGIFLSGNASVNNTIQGNYIGTDITGTNALSNTRNGVLISEAPANLLGGTVPTARNLISGNGQSGVYLFGAGARSNQVSGNYLGVDQTGGRKLGNAVDGVSIFSASANFVGGAASGAGNVISGNKERGVYISGPGATNNLVQGNLVGTDATGLVDLGNEFTGVGIDGVASNLVGGDSPGSRNLISGNNQSGVAISGSQASNNVVQGNFVGTAITGLAALSNSFDGIVISDSANNLIGGPTDGAANLISGNFQNGIFIVGITASANRIEGNVIGADASRKVPLPNRGAGVRIESSANQIGRVGGKPNVISGNLQSGVFLIGSAASGNRIQGNTIGTDSAGELAVPNGIAGIGVVGASSNLIGGALAGAGNLISGNRDSGIYLSEPGTSKNSIQGNSIGVNASGTVAIPNIIDGVSLYGARANLIGGPDLLAGNLISGNNQAGIFLSGAAASNNLIQRNLIGVQRNGTSGLGNRFHGIEIDENAGSNQVGGVSQELGNRIGYSRTAGYDGVRVHSGLATMIRYNAIFANAGLAIDLGVDGITLNDLGDVDEGANRLQNFPVLSSVSGGLATFIRGSVNSAPLQVLAMDFYLNDQSDESSYGEAAQWLGSAQVQTDNAGNASFTLSFPVPIQPGKFLAATCTDAAGNTSELSMSTRVSESGDGDGDGMPDDYELTQNLNPFSPQDAAADIDQDGLTNVEEYRAGTNPHDAKSTLKLESRLTTDSEFVLTLLTAPGRRYRLEYTDKLGESWLTLREFSSQGGTMEFIDALSKLTRCYRVILLP